MDLLTFIGWTVLFFLAYKIGVYVDHKLKEKKKAPTERAGVDSDPESKR